METLERLELSPVAARIKWFCEKLTEATAIHWKEMGFTFAEPDKYMVDSVGHKYARIVRIASYRQRWDNGTFEAQSAYCFVDVLTGDILKAGTWKAPAKNGIRGNVKEDSALDIACIYDLKYLNGGNSTETVASILKRKHKLKN